MITMPELCKFAQTRAANPDKTLIEVGVLAGVCPRLLRGLELGVDPMKCKGSGWVANVTREVSRAIAGAENVRAHNAAVAVAKGKPCPHVTAFRSDAHPFTLAAVRKWHDQIQREDSLQESLGPSQVSLGLKSTGTLKDELIHALQDGWSRR